MKRIFGLVMALIVSLLVSISPVNAERNTYKTTMPASECVEGEEGCTGYAAGSAVAAGDNVIIKGNSYFGNKLEAPSKYDAMKVGPYIEGNDTTIAEGIHKELKINLSTTIKTAEFFEISLSLKNDKGEYVNEVNIMTQKGYDEKFHITVLGSNLAEVEAGVYTYTYDLFVKNNQSHITLTILDSKGTEVGTATYIIDNTFKGPDVKTIDAEKTSIRWIWFCNVQVADGIAVDNKADMEIVPESISKDVAIDNKNFSDVINETLANTEDETLKEFLENHNVTVELVADKVEPTEEKAAEFTNSLKEGKIVEYLDINIVLLENGKDIKHLSSLSKGIELSAILPELPEVAKGYTRKYYVLREHDGKIERLDATLSEDGKTISFVSDKFSTYALAYADVVDKVDETVVENPETGDHIGAYVAMLLCSIAAAGAIFVIAKVNSKRNAE